MYIPNIPDILQRRTLITNGLPLDHSNFTLDSSGVAGVFGGDVAVSAMATVHVYENRQWIGWYNSPGSYEIAKRYGLLAKSRIFCGFFPGSHTDPATLFNLDGLKGPKFMAAHSGTIIEQTGHIAALFMNECAARKEEVVHGRESRHVGVTIAELDYIPDPRTNPRRIQIRFPILAIVPIAVSIGTCVASGVFRDWFSFSLILFGILTSGVSCAVIGSAKLAFSHPKAADGSPLGDGILTSSNEVVLLKGEEGAVNSITRGSFSLDYASKPRYTDIGFCSLLLTIQFISQLLLIPQASLFGQLMFVASLGASWAYNSYLSSLDLEEIQRDILCKNVLKNPVLTRYRLGTYTTMVVFALLVLGPKEPKKMLNLLLPNDTGVWEHWKKRVLEQLSHKVKFEFIDSDTDLEGFSPRDKNLLGDLYSDARTAYNAYTAYRDAKIARGEGDSKGVKGEAMLNQQEKHKRGVEEGKGFPPV